MTRANKVVCNILADDLYSQSGIPTKNQKKMIYDTYDTALKKMLESVKAYSKAYRFLNENINPGRMEDIAKQYCDYIKIDYICQGLGFGDERFIIKYCINALENHHTNDFFEGMVMYVTYIINIYNSDILEDKIELLDPPVLIKLPKLVSINSLL